MISFFLLKELARTTVVCRAVLARTLLALGVGAVATMTVGVAALMSTDGSEGRLFVLFKPEISGDQIRAIYRQVREWEIVSEVSYIAPSERSPDLGEAGRAGYLRVTARQLAELPDLETALGALAGVAAVESHKKGALGTALSALGEPSLILAIIILIGAFLAVLITALRALLGAWTGELEALYLAGVPARSARGAFFVWTLGVGTAGALLGIALILLLRSLDSTHLWLPELWHPSDTRHATLAMLGFSAGVSALAWLLGILGIRRR